MRGISAPADVSPIALAVATLRVTRSARFSSHQQAGCELPAYWSCRTGREWQSDPAPVPNAGAAPRASPPALRRIRYAPESCCANPPGPGSFAPGEPYGQSGKLSTPPGDYPHRVFHIIPVPYVRLDHNLQRRSKFSTSLLSTRATTTYAIFSYCAGNWLAVRCSPRREVAALHCARGTTWIW
jgi:hypothetical protein